MPNTLLTHHARRWPARAAMLARAAVVCGGVLAATGAASFEYWIGRPTMGDYMRKSLKDGILAAGDYKKEMAKFQVDMNNARKAYFEASSRNREAAGDEFGKYLFAKDLMIATPMLANGFSEQSAGVGKLFAALNGNRVVDGGIRPAAQEQYEDWVRAMRKALGAKGEADTIFVNQTTLMNALESTQGVYDKYRKERDQAESLVWRSISPPPEERVGNRPLRQPGLEMSVTDSITPRRIAMGYMQSEVELAEKAGARRIQCEYGPSYNENGQPYFGSYQFWKGRAPDNVARLIVFDRFAVGGVEDKAVASCPKQEAEAARISNLPIKAEISAALKEEVSSKQTAAREAERARVTEMQAREAKARAEAKAKLDAERAATTTANMQSYTQRMLREQREYQEKLANRQFETTGRKDGASSGGVAGGAPVSPATPDGRKPAKDYKRYAEATKLCNAKVQEMRDSKTDREVMREERRRCFREAEVASGG